MNRRRFLHTISATPFLLHALPARAQISGVPLARFERLVAAYPDHLTGIDAGSLVWKQGARMALDDGVKDKTFEQMLRNASIADQMRQVYRRGKMTGLPGVNESPGRIRHEGFFAKMYGDCRKNEVAKKMRTVRWMPKTKAQTIQATTVNDVAG